MLRVTQLVAAVVLAIAAAACGSAGSADTTFVPSSFTAEWIAPQTLPASIEEGDQPVRAEDDDEGTYVTDLTCTGHPDGSVLWQFELRDAPGRVAFGAAALEGEQSGAIFGFFRMGVGATTISLNSADMTAAEAGIAVEDHKAGLIEATECSVHLLGFEEGAGSLPEVRQVVWTGPLEQAS